MPEVREIDRLKFKRLQKACDRIKFDVGELLRSCQHGLAQFHDVDEACAITQLAISGPHKVCLILALGGTLEGVRELEPVIVNFAREQGCQAIQTIGRPGFERVYEKLAEGYRPVGTMYEKSLEV